ncbi:hypothetical protein ACQKM9_04805 [Viridibacillus sp. NPDC093762]|uniref:hypothetical protein n=1 Tax=Viridibacillus sp. NPDC093762 TaxID=3390720 RepID=UPI003D01DC83
MDRLDDKLQKLNTIKRSHQEKLHTLEKLSNRIDRIPTKKVNWRVPVILASTVVVCIILLLTTLNGPLQKTAKTATEPITNFTSTVELERIYYVDWSKDVNFESFLARASKLYLDMNTIEDKQQLSTFSYYFSHLKEVQHINKNELSPFNDLILQARDGREWHIKIYENPGEPSILRDMETDRYFEINTKSGNFDEDFIDLFLFKLNMKPFYISIIVNIIPALMRLIEYLVLKLSFIPSIPKLERKNRDRIIQLIIVVVCLLAIVFLAFYFQPINILVLLSILTLAIFSKFYFDWIFIREHHDSKVQQKYKLYLSIQIIIYLLMICMLIVIIH